METEILNLLAKIKAEVKAYSASTNVDSDKEGQFYSWDTTLNSMEKYFRNKLNSKNCKVDENEFTYNGRNYKAVEYTEDTRGLGSPCLYCCFYKYNNSPANRCIKRLGENIPPCSSAFRKDKKTVFFLPTL